MKIRSNYISKLLTGVLLLSGLSMAMSGCSRSLTLIPEGQNPSVTILASVEKSAQTKLTPSDLTNGGVFQAGDEVGLYLFDQRGGIGSQGVYSYLNTKYVAREVAGNVLFEPVAGEGSVFYHTYYLHNVYAYYPFDERNNSLVSADFIKASVALDQSTVNNYAKSDFLTCRLGDVKPQQIDPAAPELTMSFSHQFTSVVVKVRNADDSPLFPLPVVSIVNTKTQVEANIASTTLTFSNLTVPAPVVIQQKAGYSNVNHPTQLCYFGIVVPQGFSAGKSIVKIKLGTGTTARVYEYAPKSSDPILTAGGFIQGREHVFDFVISGTELVVQGGEVGDWGVGTKSVTEISGEGRTAAKMIFDVINATGEALTKMHNIQSAQINIDGVVRNTVNAVFDEATMKITCRYYQEDAWGYDVSRVNFKAGDGSSLMDCVPVTPMRIKGNPIDKNYATVIATIDATTGEITAK